VCCKCHKTLIQTNKQTSEHFNGNKWFIVSKASRKNGTPLRNPLSYGVLKLDANHLKMKEATELVEFLENDTPYPKVDPTNKTVSANNVPELNH